MSLRDILTSNTSSDPNESWKDFSVFKINTQSLVANVLKTNLGQVIAKTGLTDVSGGSTYNMTPSDLINAVFYSNSSSDIQLNLPTLSSVLSYLAGVGIPFTFNMSFKICIANGGSATLTLSNSLDSSWGMIVNNGVGANETAEYTVLINSPSLAFVLGGSNPGLISGSKEVDLVFDGVNVGMTYTGGVKPLLFYKILGKLIFYSVLISLTLKGSSSGTATIINLPKTSDSNNIVGNLTTSNVAIGGSFIDFSSRVNANSQSIGLFQGGNLQPLTVLTDANFQDNSVVNISGFYYSV